MQIDKKGKGQRLTNGKKTDKIWKGIGQKLTRFDKNWSKIDKIWQNLTKIVRNWPNWQESSKLDKKCHEFTRLLSNLVILVKSWANLSIFDQFCVKSCPSNSYQSCSIFDCQSISFTLLVNFRDLQSIKFGQFLTICHSLN